MELSDPLALSYQDLACYTDNFAESNYLGHFQFGKFYHGKIVRNGFAEYVMVKIWEVSKKYNYKCGDNESRLTDEVALLRNHILSNHPNLLRLYGYCYEEGHLGVVYDFKPFDSLYNLIAKDDFTWLQRISVSLRFASLLRFLHSGKCDFKPIIVRNIDCAHIVLDENYNPKLCDFGLVSGGIIPDRTIYKCHHVIGSYGYIDMMSYYKGHYSEKQDVFAFGVILLSLISKRVFTEEDWQNDARDVCEWAWGKFYDCLLKDSATDSKMPKFSLADQSLAADPDFDPVDGRKITALALDCTDKDLSTRPKMKQVVRSLLKLKVVKKHAADLGLNQFLRPM